MGEPRAGRSDLLEAIARPLDPEGLGRRNVAELDFHNKAVDRPIRVEVVIGDLDEDCRQNFLEHLEIWNVSENLLVEQAESVETIRNENLEWVLRLAYLAEARS